MSEENVEIARRCLQAFDRRDYETAIPCFHHDAEWHNTAAFPGPRTIVGPTAIVEFWQELVESFDQGQGGTAIENLAANGDRVAIALRTRGRGTASGVPVDVRYALMLTVRGQKIERVDVSGDYRSALEAAGLEE